MKRSARNVRPTLSDDPRAKLLAALNWLTGRIRGGADYKQAPMYFDACREWHDKLSADDRELVLTLAESWAARTRAQPKAWRHRCRRRRGVRCSEMTNGSAAGA